MTHRAIRAFAIGFFVGFCYEYLSEIWREAKEDLQKCQRSELTESYSRGGCDIWDLKPNN